MLLVRFCEEIFGRKRRDLLTHPQGLSPERRNRLKMQKASHCTQIFIIGDFSSDVRGFIAQIFRSPREKNCVLCPYQTSAHLAPINHRDCPDHHTSPGMHKPIDNLITTSSVSSFISAAITVIYSKARNQHFVDFSVRHGAALDTLLNGLCSHFSMPFRVLKYNFCFSSSPSLPLGREYALMNIMYWINRLFGH